MKEVTQGVCPCCKRNVGLSYITLDHIYPISKANDDYKRTGVKRVYTIDDIQPLCRSCNSSKLTKEINFMILNQVSI
jgi:5-methylcytosine-specific restriction endonuclease McrA